MSRITIIIETGLVKEDGIGCDGVDVSSAPSGLHALQWYETKGELEYMNLPDGTKPQNEFITELPDWVNTCITNMQATRIANEKAMQDLLNNMPKQ